jgi:hypothetical protein
MRITMLIFGLIMTLAPSVALASDDGLTLPSIDLALVYIAPTPEQPNYTVRVQAFVQATVPEPFRSAFDGTGGSDVWGLPTSEPAADPNNPNFVYQRFEHGILFHNATEGTTEPLV